MKKKKKKVDIPPELAAQVLFMSDRTCCVCRSEGKPVQIHHIDEDPSHNTFANLSVLCFDCHRETQIRGGFDRKLDADQVVLYRNDWLRVVAADRATCEAGREVAENQNPFDVELVTSIAEIYRENSQFELLAVHYDAIGNYELRDKYVELAIADDASDESIFYLRATVQKRPDLVPKEIIECHLAKYVGREDSEQYARALYSVGRYVDAATQYIQGISQSLKEGNWFGAGFYLKEFFRKNLHNEVLIAAYRKATDEGNLWWQVRALQELGWHSELNDLLLKKKDEVNNSDDIFLLELLAEAEGDSNRAKEFRKEIARGSKVIRAGEQSEEDE